MRVHVINLAAATDRLAHTTQVLGSAGIAFERFDALGPNQALAHPCFSQIPRMIHRSWTFGELGCLLSHYEVWRTIAAGPDPFGAVLEDDLFVDPRLKALLAGEFALPPDADLIKLETTSWEVSVSRRAKYRNQGTCFHRLRSVHYGTGAYLVSRSAAEMLVNSIEAFNVPIDDALFSPGHPISGSMKIYQLIPALAVQNVIMADAGLRPKLSSELERERTVARELRQAMDESQNATVRTQRPTHRRQLALRWRFNRISKRIFEKRLIVPFGSNAQPSKTV